MDSYLFWTCVAPVILTKKCLGMDVATVKPIIYVCRSVLHIVVAALIFIYCRHSDIVPYKNQASLSDRSASYTKKLFPKNPLIGCPGHYGLLRHYIPLWDFFAISDIIYKDSFYCQYIVSAIRVIYTKSGEFYST